MKYLQMFDWVKFCSGLLKNESGKNWTVSINKVGYRISIPSQRVNIVRVNKTSLIAEEQFCSPGEGVLTLYLTTIIEAVHFVRINLLGDEATNLT